MSARLGPIHHWMYRKISIQRKLVGALLGLVDSRSEITIPWSRVDSPLAEIIDETNIHGWLQDQVHEVESILAQTISFLLKRNDITQDNMKNVFYQIGTTTTTIEAMHSLKEQYQAIQDVLLDGMPCDHVNEVISTDSSEVVWQRRVCLYTEDYERVGIDISIYYELRDALIRGLLAKTNSRYERINDVTYRIVEDVV